MLAARQGEIILTEISTTPRRHRTVQADRTWRAHLFTTVEDEAVRCTPGAGADILQPPGLCEGDPGRKEGLPAAVTSEINFAQSQVPAAVACGMDCVNRIPTINIKIRNFRRNIIAPPSNPSLTAISCPVITFYLST